MAEYADEQSAGLVRLARLPGVRARLGLLSTLSILHSKSVSYDAFVWVCRALNIQKWRFTAGQDVCVAVLLLDAPAPASASAG